MPQEEANCGIPNQCQRVVPTWTVLLDNVPTLALFILGAVLLGLVWPPLALVFLAYCALSIVLFWHRICTYCHHYGTRACPCGYGVIAARLFRFRGNKDFSSVFRRNIAIMFPCWLVPLIAGAYLLFSAYSWHVPVLFAAFCIDGFVLIPGIAKLVGCRNCELADQCPWMTWPRRP